MGNGVNPFFAGGAIADRRFFVGRSPELREIFSKMFADQPTSINVVGPKRIGKSSLLRHVVRTYEERSPEWNRKAQGFVVVYIDFDKTSCQTQAGFYGAIAKELLAAVPKKTSWWQFQDKPRLEAPLKVTPFDGLAFEKALRVWKGRGILPVLCLDRFERLLDYPDEFPKGFYDGLRSLMDDGAVMLLIASRELLTVYSRRAQITSSFFNLGHMVPLREFSDGEAMEVSRLPAGGEPIFSTERQGLVVKWGKKKPFCLQLAGQCLFEAQQQGESEKWAWQRFQEQMVARRAKIWEVNFWLRQLLRSLGLLGRGADLMTNKKLNDTVKGIGIVAAVIVGLILGAVNVAKLSDPSKWFEPDKSETKPTVSPEPSLKR
ncbi:MAG: ATP-binding protein [Cyanobacteria bacterium P01_C01_bin.89]